MIKIEIEKWIEKIKDYLFPALNRNKEIVYWSTELIAALIMAIFLLKVETKEADFRDAGTVRVVAPPTEADKKYNAEQKEGMTREEAFVYNRNPYLHTPSHVQNNEYAWIAFFYLIKHILFLADSIFMFLKKLNKPYDLVGPIANIIMWLTIVIFGFMYSGIEIHGGLRLVGMTDSRDRAKENSSNPNSKHIQKLDGKVAFEQRLYDKYVKIKHVWICFLLVFLVNLSFWILGLVQKRSSFLTNQAVSTWIIPFQIMLYNFFLLGKTYRTNKYTEPIKPWLRDPFEARHIFFIFYVGAFLGLLLFMPACSFMAFKTFRTCKMTMVKWILWAVLWVFLFMFALAMDTLLHDTNRATYLPLAQTSIIFSIFIGIAIAVITIWQKFKNGDQAQPNLGSNPTPDQATNPTPDQTANPITKPAVNLTTNPNPNPQLAYLE